MKPDTLSRAFDAGDFEETGKALVKFLADTFINADQRTVIPYKTPEEQYRYWKEEFGKQGNPLV